MRTPVFLTLAEVIAMHADQIQRYGGQEGVRDFGLLESAIAQPEATYGGAWLHHDLHEMAAAYAFHLCQNHPFYDGNKRAALVCALMFLRFNRVASMPDPRQQLKDAMLNIASGRMSKQEFAALLRRLARPR